MRMTLNSEFSLRFIILDYIFRHFGALGNVEMSANIVNVNVTDDVISLDPESDAFIGGRAFNLHALPDDFQVSFMRSFWWNEPDQKEKHHLQTFYSKKDNLSGPLKMNRFPYE